MRLPRWLRLWLHAEDTRESRAALQRAVAAHAEVRAIAARARHHREQNHFAERIAGVLDEDDRRRARARKRPRRKWRT